MKAFWVAVFVSIAMQVGAFQSVLWLEKRDTLHEEALKMQKSYLECLEKVSSPAQDVLVPIENFPDGSVKSSVAAKRAQFFLETGLIWGEGVLIRQYDETGKIVVEVEAENCVVDRKKRSGWVEGKAQVKYSKTVVEGRKVYFSMIEEYLMILDGTQIESKDLKFGGLKL